MMTSMDMGADAWAIDDELVQLREWGTDRSYALPGEPGAELAIGSAEACTLRPGDPTGGLAPRHARLVREAARWIAQEVGGEHGMRLDGVPRAEARLAPGAELGVGGVTLIAESPRLIALRGFLARLLGWSSDRGEAVDLAVRSVRRAAIRGVPLALCGDGDLVPIARGLHRCAPGGDRPFVLCDPRRRGTAQAASAENYPTGMRALQAAIDGSICLWAKRLPGDFAELTAALREPGTRVQLIVCSPKPPEDDERAPAPIEVPPVSSRPDEIEQIIDEYAGDAEAALGAPACFTEVDRDWVRLHSATSLPEIEKGTLRIVALRKAGNIARAAALIGMAHASLGEWIGRRGLPMGNFK